MAPFSRVDILTLGVHRVRSSGVMRCVFLLQRGGEGSTTGTETKHCRMPLLTGREGAGTYVQYAGRNTVWFSYITNDVI